MAPCWVKALWQYLDEQGIILWSSNTRKMVKPRQFNRSIMEIAAGVCTDPAELCRINKVRIHLEVY